MLPSVRLKMGTGKKYTGTEVENLGPLRKVRFSEILQRRPVLAPHHLTFRFVNLVP
jgi:hypothetical protein